jgi:hypothetical protein
MLDPSANRGPDCRIFYLNQLAVAVAAGYPRLSDSPEKSRSIREVGSRLTALYRVVSGGSLG